MRFGVCTGPENLAALTVAGFDYIEPGVSVHLQPEKPEELIMPPLVEIFDSSPVKAETFNILLPGDLKVVGPETDPVRQSAYLDAAFRRARRLGGRIAVFGSGKARQIPPGWPLAEAHTQILAFLQRCGDIAAAHEMIVAMEPLEEAECNFINSVAEADALTQEAARPALGVLSDLYHVTQDEQSYRETGDAAARLRHVHVAGREGRRAPVAQDREFLRDFFTVLKASGYAGRISVEGGWQDLPAQAAEALETLRRAWEEA